MSQRFAHSDQARIVERYTLSEEDGQKVLTAEMTMTDPAFYTKAGFGDQTMVDRPERIPDDVRMQRTHVVQSDLEELQKTATAPAAK